MPSAALWDQVGSALTQDVGRASIFVQVNQSIHFKQGSKRCLTIYHVYQLVKAHRSLFCEEQTLEKEKKTSKKKSKPTAEQKLRFYQLFYFCLCNENY